MEFDALYLRLNSLTAYRELLAEPVLSSALTLLEALSRQDGSAALTAWGELVYRLDESRFSSLGAWVNDRLLYSDAPWPRSVAEGREEPALEDRARRDVETLAALARLDLPSLLNGLDLPAELELSGGTAEVPLPFDSLKDQYRIHGCGPFARHRAFLWENGQLLPVECPDIPAQTELIGYRRQRDQVEANTRALLSGRRVNNVLLFGDSGTGKSATVKSLLGLPDTEDLRLIEVEKNSVSQLPRLIRSLAHRRQKFILFIDDLAFDEDDMTYSVLKTILEGGLEPRSANVAIYATSNRRNLVRQTFSSRAGDEVDRDETIQEKTALADRFGLRIPYLGFSKADYLELVEYLARQAGVPLSPSELTAQAVRWDARHPGRSPRTARQFIDSLEKA